MPTAARTNAKHRVNTDDNAPTYQRAYPVSATKRLIVQEEVEKMFKKGIIQLSESPGCHLYFRKKAHFRKKDGSFNFFVDFCNLNSIMKNDVCLPLRIDGTLDCLKSSNNFHSCVFASIIFN